MTTASRLGRRNEAREERRAAARVVEYFHRGATRIGRRLLYDAHEGTQLQTRRSWRHVRICRWRSEDVCVEIEKSRLASLQLDDAPNWLTIVVGEWLARSIAE